MEFSSAIAFRHSIRYFSARPVPDPVLQAIAEDATRAPSQLNGQDWKIWISTGKSLDAIRSEFDERNRAGYPAFDRLREPPALGALARSPGPDGSGRGGTRGAGA